MKIPQWTKPTMWGAVGGAIAAIVVGFAWGGWVTGGTAEQLQADSAETAVVQVFAPLCVAKAEQQPDQLTALRNESAYKRDSFVIAAGWVDNVSETYQRDVAKICATTLIEGMK